MAQAPDDAVDRLYGLPLDAFVGERDALAKELRGAGQRDEAAAVKALKKPSVAAWAVNQALRTQTKAARELWTAGDELAAAQEAILAGTGSGADLRAATERERAAVEPLVDAARGLLTATGGDLSEATIERVRQTLHAGAIDPDAREEVASGRAVRERAPQGLFGGGVAEAPAPAKRAGKAEAPAPAKRGSQAEARAPAKRGSKAGVAERDSKADAAAQREAARREREEAARERKEAVARERARKAAEQRVAKAEKALAIAEQRTADASERLEQARSDERSAAEALAEAKAELRAAERG
jgi:hypothetical protein